MYIFKRSSLFFLISILFLFPLATFAGEGCMIDKGPPPALAKYVRDTLRITSEILSKSSGKNQCNGTNGSFTNEKRFTSLIDSIDAKNPVFPSLITDFRYNILLVANGDSRVPVISQGTILRNLEATIINALKSVSSTCTLGEQYDGTTFENALTTILVKNKQVESYYRSVALGDPRNTDNIDTALATEIANNYSPEMTKNCKDTSNISDVAGKFLERIQKLGEKTEGSDKDWKEAIALFRGTSKTGNYNELKKSLLNNELSRQGMSRRAINLMVGNLSCVQKKTSQTDSIEDWGKARSECVSNMVIGAENLTNWMKAPIIQATNADQYLARALLYSKRKDQSNEKMTKFWTSIEDIIKTDDENINEKILTDLIDLHVGLIETNDLLKKRIPEMQANCRKGQPGIGC